MKTALGGPFGGKAGKAVEMAVDGLLRAQGRFGGKLTFCLPYCLRANETRAWPC